MNGVIVKDKNASLIRRGEIWIYSGGIEDIKGYFRNGDIVKVYDKSGRFIASAFINTRSIITLRIITYMPINERQLIKMIGRSIFTRQLYYTKTTNAYRLVNGEGDMLPGLIIDNYNGHYVMLINSLAWYRRTNKVVEYISKVFKPKSIYMRMSRDIAHKEGMEYKEGEVFGNCPEYVVIEENAIKFKVDIKRGHKTGFYLDQKDSRKEMFFVARDMSVLDVFSYTGGFGLYALFSGARHVSFVESSKEAISLAKENIRLNNIKASKVEFYNKDAFEFMDMAIKSSKQYDIIVLDPPSFARSETQTEGAIKGYRKLLYGAMNIINKGGLLFVFSCSHYITEDTLLLAIHEVAKKEKKRIRVIKRLTSPFDHPFNINKNSHYLNGFIIHIDW